MRRVKSLRARTDKYIDRQTGQEKQGYMTCGYILQKDDGAVMYKIDSLPVNFDGWLFAGDLETKRPQQQVAQSQDDGDLPF